MKTLGLQHHHTKIRGFGLIDALLAFLFLGPIFYLYSTTQVGQKISLMTASEINQGVNLAENIRLTLIAHGREQLQTQPSMSDADFSAKLRQFGSDLSEQYTALQNASPCNQNEPMMSWTGGSCLVTRFTVDIDASAYSASEKGQPMNIKISWADQTGNQVYHVRALVGKY